MRILFEIILLVLVLKTDAKGFKLDKFLGNLQVCEIILLELLKLTMTSSQVYMLDKIPTSC